jgi:Prp8 binding protein
LINFYKRMPEKRAADGALVLAPPQAKRARPAGELVAAGRGNQVMEAGPPRSSNMEAPIMLLTGHSGEVYTSKFHPAGNLLASAGYERQVFLWTVYGECDNLMTMSGHTGSVVQLTFNPAGDTIITASTDKTVGVFDTNTGERLKRMKGHTSFVNSVDHARGGKPLVLSGGDDCQIKVWDTRRRQAVTTINNNYQVTAVQFGEDPTQLVTAGIDNMIKIWDSRKNALLTEVGGHTDTVTGMSLNPDGTHVLTNAMDNTLRVTDIRPFCTGERMVKMFCGHQHNYEKNLLHCAWSPDGAMVSAGSSDRNVYVWDTESGNIVYKLPGHLGSVNDVDFHSVEPIILSCGSDKQIYLGEFEP